MEDVAPMIATVILILGTIAVIRILSQNKRLDKLAKMHSDLQTRIIDRFGTTQEMLDYLHTEPGTRLLDAPVIERGSPYSRVLGSVQTGIVLAVVGVAFLASTAVVRIPEPEGIVFVGMLSLALGIGFLASAWAAHALSKSYGLMNGRGSDADR